jgi:hypothetical protein
MSDIEIETEATFSQSENEKVVRILRSMEVEEQEQEQSKHPPGISPTRVNGEFPGSEKGQVIILKKKPVVLVVPQLRKKEVIKPDVGMPTGPKVGKKPNVKKSEQKKKAEEK